MTPIEQPTDGGTPAADSTEQPNDKTITVGGKDYTLEDLQNPETLKDPEVVKELLAGNMRNDDYTKKAQQREKDYKAKVKELEEKNKPQTAPEPEDSEDIKAAKALIQETIEAGGYVKQEKIDSLEKAKASERELVKFLGENTHIDEKIFRNLGKANLEMSNEQIAKDFNLHANARASGGKDLTGKPYNLRENSDKVEAFEQPKWLKD